MVFIVIIICYLVVTKNIRSLTTVPQLGRDGLYLYFVYHDKEQFNMALELKDIALLGGVSVAHSWQLGRFIMPLCRI
jgi:hypothetical protein